MPLEIRLSHITEAGAKPLLSVDEGPVTVGRVPENVVPIDRESISRRHAALLAAGDYWLLTDFGSSNGSWLNGDKLERGELKILKSGDTLQFADYAVLFEEAEARPPSEEPGEVSLLVFYKEAFHAEARISQLSEAFQLGGEKADMSIEGIEIDRVIFQCSSKESGPIVEPGDSLVEVHRNGEPLEGATILSHGDQLLVAPYRFVVAVRSAPVERTEEPVAEASSGRAARHTTMLSAAEVAELTAGISELRGENLGSDEDNAAPADEPVDEGGWVSESARRRQSLGQPVLFGTPPGDVSGSEAIFAQTQTMPSLGAGGGTSYEMSSSQKFSQSNRALSDSETQSGKDNVLVVVGACIFAALILFCVYMVLSAVL